MPEVIVPSIADQVRRAAKQDRYLSEAVWETELADSARLRAEYGFGVIGRAVAAVTGVSVKRIKSGCRKQRTCWARHLAAYVIRERTHAGFEEIARALGRSDHSTAHHNCHTAENLLAGSPVFRDWHDAVRKLLEQGAERQR